MERGRDRVNPRVRLGLGLGRVRVREKRTEKKSRTDLCNYASHILA